MKLIIRILSILLVLNVSSILFSGQVSAQPIYVSFQVFYNQLGPYGQWVDYPGYGFVWFPDLGPDFVPYATAGYWVFTDFGWTWVSDYPWGWAPFHYGRWGYDDFYGWFWIPGNEWGPAWVVWRRADGFFGWEPMGPGVSINIIFDNSYNIHSHHWIFVRDGDIENHDIHRYVVGQPEERRIIQNSTVITNTYVNGRRHETYVSGPSRDNVERYTGRRITPVPVQERNNPGQDVRDGRLQIYRPEVERGSHGQRSAPSNVTNLNDIRRPSERGRTYYPPNEPPSGNRSEQPENNARPSRPRNEAPANNRGEQRETPEKPRNNNARPSNPRNETPSNTNRRGQRPGNEKQRDNNARPSQQQKKENPSEERGNERRSPGRNE